MNIPSLQDKVSPEEWQLRVDLAACYRLVAQYGWSDLVFTHISARVPGPEHHFLINPYGLMFDEITASSLVKVDQGCNKLSDSPYPVNPAGFVIHSAIHAGREDVGCVLHTHTRAGVGVSAQKGGLLPISQQSTFVLGAMGVHDYEGVAVRDDSDEPTLGSPVTTEAARDDSSTQPAPDGPAGTIGAIEPLELDAERLLAEPCAALTPALLDLASAERVELASRLASMYEALYAAASEMPRDEFYGLVAERLAGTLGLRRVSIRIIDGRNGRAIRVGSYGPPLSELPDETPTDVSATSRDLFRPAKARSRSSTRRSSCCAACSGTSTRSRCTRRSTRSSSRRCASCGSSSGCGRSSRTASSTRTG